MTRGLISFTARGAKDGMTAVLPNATVLIAEVGSSTPIGEPMFATAVSSTPLSNPLTADGSGLVSFYLQQTEDSGASDPLRHYVDAIITSPGWPTQRVTVGFTPDPASIPPAGAASGDLVGTYPGPTIAPGAVTLAKLGSDVVDVGGHILKVIIAEVLGLADLSDVSGTFAAGQTLRRKSTGFVPSGLIFSVVAEGGVADGLQTSSAANASAYAAASAKAQAAGGIVEFDAVGTFIVDGNLPIYTHTWPRGLGYGTVVKLKDSAPAGTHVFATNNFATLTQTQGTSGEYEWCLTDMLVHGNKANNASGGHGLANYGYAFFVDRVIFYQANSSNIWSEFGTNTEPISGSYGSLRQRAAHLGRVWSIDAGCATVAAANGRAGRAAVGGAGVSWYGPEDSAAEYLETFKVGSLVGIGLLVDALDYAAGSGGSGGAFVVANLVAWGNHDRAVVFNKSATVGVIHAEGAGTCNVDCSDTVQIGSGHIFIPHPGGINLRFNSGSNFNRIGCYMDGGNGCTYLDFSASSACSDSQLSIVAANGLSSGANTLVTTAVTLTLPPRTTLSIVANNFGGGTSTIAAGNGLPASAVLVATAGGEKIAYASFGEPLNFAVFTKAGLPTTSDIPTGTASVWKDSSGGGVYLATNDGGTVKKVAMV